MLKGRSLYEKVKKQEPEELKQTDLPETFQKFVELQEKLFPVKHLKTNVSQDLHFHQC